MENALLYVKHRIIIQIKNGEKKHEDLSAAVDDSEGEQPITLTDNNDLGYNGGGYGGF